MRSGFLRFIFAVPYRFLVFPAIISFLLTACFSGQSDKQVSREKSVGKQGTMDPFRLSQLTVPTNAAYSSVLEELERNDLKNIDRALTVFTNNRADSLSRDSMLVSFSEFMNDVMQEYYATKLTGNQKMIDQFENRDDQSEAKKLIASLAAHGILLTYRGGDFYLEPDLDFVYSHLEGVLTTGSREYLHTSILLSKGFLDEKNQPLSPPDSLAAQVATWEGFMVNNPGYVMKDVILAQYIDVLAAYLSGLEQMPLFDASTKMLEPAFQNSYLHYIEKYPNRESAKTVKKFYDLLASKGFKYDESLDSFLSEVNFNPTQNPQ